MWLLKVRGFDEGNIYGTKTKKCKVSMHYYPVNYYMQNNTYYFIAVGIVEGSEQRIKSFFEELKKDNKPSKTKRYVAKLEVNGNFFVCITAQHKSIELQRYVHYYYNPKLIHVNPAIIDRKGFEEWNIATMDRKELEKLLIIGRKRYNVKILLIKKAKLNNIGVLSIFPSITDKQKKAFMLAIENRYYEYPREIELEKLAKINKLALSTYQAHLRKAERQLLLFAAKKYF